MQLIDNDIFDLTEIFPVPILDLGADNGGRAHRDMVLVGECMDDLCRLGHTAKLVGNT